MKRMIVTGQEIRSGFLVMFVQLMISSQNDSRMSWYISFLENFFSRQLLKLREFFFREENDDKNRSDQLLLVKYLDQSFCRLASG